MWSGKRDGPCWEVNLHGNTQGKFQKKWSGKRTGQWWEVHLYGNTWGKFRKKWSRKRTGLWPVVFYQGFHCCDICLVHMCVFVLSVASDITKNSIAQFLSYWDTSPLCVKLLSNTVELIWSKYPSKFFIYNSPLKLILLSHATTSLWSKPYGT